MEAERLNELFVYDDRSGILSWRENRGKCRRGVEAGTLKKNGYRQVYVDGKCQLVHRVIVVIAGLALTNTQEVDHINGVRDDNRLSNLRVVGRAENARNLKKQSGNTSGHTGVSWHKAHRKWRAYIGFRHLGMFDELSDAVASRVAAANLSGYHPNHGGR